MILVIFPAATLTTLDLSLAKRSDQNTEKIGHHLSNRFKNLGSDAVVLP